MSLWKKCLECCLPNNQKMLNGTAIILPIDILSLEQLCIWVRGEIYWDQESWLMSSVPFFQEKAEFKSDEAIYSSVHYYQITT